MKKSRLFLPFAFTCFLLAGCEGVPGGDSAQGDGKSNLSAQGGTVPMIFAAFAETEEQKYHTQVLAESIREFAGARRNAPVWIYMPPELLQTDKAMLERMKDLRVEVKSSRAPAESLQFYFARKVFASAEAEAEAEGNADILVWMDEDTIVLREPSDLILQKGVDFGYRPVMHNRSGSLYSQPPDPFWSRIFEVLSIKESSFFPMVTPGDEATIRPYFNAGLLVVRPGRGILRKWAQSFSLLYRDPVLKEMCRKDVEKRIFLHQTALAGAVLNHVKREQMAELSPRFNYPLFFHETYPAAKTFDSLDEIVTLRYDVYFRSAAPGWSKRLKGEPKIVAWLKARFPGKEAG